MISKDVCDSQGKTIAIVGFSARAASQIAKKAGFDVVAVDVCADRDLICDCRSHYLLDDPEWPDALNAYYPSAPLLLTGGMEHRTHLVERCHAVANRCGPTALQLVSMRSLDNWAKWANSCDIGWPITCRTWQEVLRSEKPHRQRDWLMKPFQSAGGIGTTELFCTNASADDFTKEQSNFYFQKRLPGETIGVTFLSSEFGSTLVGATAAWIPDSKLPGMNYVYCGSYGPVELTDKQLLKLQHFARTTGNESGLLGLWQADFLRYDGELTLLEINPRWSASMDILEVCLDAGLVEMHHACINMTVSHAIFSKYSNDCIRVSKSTVTVMLGKMIVYANDSFNVTQSQSDEWWSKRWSCDLGSLLNGCQFADIPCAGTAIAKGDPILTVLTTGCSSESILRKLQWTRSMISMG